MKLNQKYSEEKIDLNIKSSTVITISVIIIGGITLFESVPKLVYQLIQFFKQKMLFFDYPNFSWIILHFLSIVLAYLMITNSRKISNFIEKESGIN